MTLVDRTVLAFVVLALGALAGYLIRRRLHPAPPTSGRIGLPRGLVVVTAPYCTRCASLKERLVRSNTEFVTVDAALRPDLVADLGVMTAPTVLVIDPSGRVADREHRDFSDSRLAELALDANG